MEEIVFIIKSLTGDDTYTINVNFEPFTISCTCQAAKNRLPCKHRIHILQGHNYIVSAGPPNTESIISDIAAIAKNSNIFESLKQYEDLKNKKKEDDKKSEKKFKEYRELLTRFVTKIDKTDKKAVNANNAMQEALEEGIKTEAEIQSILRALQTVFI